MLGFISMENYMVSFPKILNFGSLNIDKIYSLDHIVRKGETISSKSYNEALGGKGLNQSIALKRAGADIYHAGCVGDEDGKVLLDYLLDNDIKSLVKEVRGKSGHAIIQVDKEANNSIIVEPGANKKIEVGYIDEVLEKFSSKDYLLLQNEVSNLPYIIDKASQKGMRIFFNPSPIDETIKEIDLAKIDTIIINQTEGREISGFCQTSDILNYFKENHPKLKVVLTLGACGGFYSYKNLKISFKSYKINPVDTTGAGDTFLGYFMASIAKGKDVGKSLDLASLAAAIACTRKGATPSIPALKEIRDYRKRIEK